MRKKQLVNKLHSYGVRWSGTKTVAELRKMLAEAQAAKGPGRIATKRVGASAAPSAEPPRG